MTIGNQMVNFQQLNYRRVVTNANVVLIQDPVSFVYLQAGKSWSGGDLPGWKTKIAQGADATNSYNLKVRKIVSKKQGYTKGPTNTNEGYKEMEHRTFGVAGPPNTWSASIIAENTNLAMHKLFKRIDELNNSVNGLENLGEFMSTIRMIRNPAKSIADYLNSTTRKIGNLQRASERAQKAIRKRTKKSGKPLSKRSKARLAAQEANRLKKAIAGSILEFNYGVKPLAGEIQNAVDAALGIFPEEGIEVVKASHTFETEAFIDSGVQPFGNRSFMQEHRDRYIYTVSLIARVRNTPRYSGMSELEQLSSRSGFDMKRIVPTLWELAPMSVFIDMFAKVGDVLTAYATDTSQVLSVQRQVTRKLLRTSVATFRYNVNDRYSYQNPDNYRPGVIVYYFKEYSREKWALSIPTLVFTIPGTRGGINSQLTSLSAFLSLTLF